MDIKIIKSKLQTSWLGQPLHFLPETDSTNARALHAIDDGAARGEVFVTDYQKEGRGRMNRQWESSKGKDLLVTLIDSAPNSPTPHHLTLVAAVGFVQGVLQICPDSKVGLKWPNDLIAGGKKLGGILTQLSPEHQLIVIGVGLNVNSVPADFSAEVAGLATSLFLLTGKMVSREELLAACLNSYEKVRKLYDTEGFPAIVNLWKKHQQILGKKVRVVEDSRSYEGTALDLDDEGFLLVKTDTKTERVISGDVTIL